MSRDPRQHDRRHDDRWRSPRPDQPSPSHEPPQPDRSTGRREQGGLESASHVHHPPHEAHPGHEHAAPNSRGRQAEAHAPGAHAGHGEHHAHMVADFRRRFWVSAGLTVPVLLLTPMIQHVLGLGDAWRFPGDAYVLWALSTAIFIYGGWPFLTGLAGELKDRTPGMMTLIGLAIGVAYAYSSAVTFGLGGMTFYWELATLIDVMLLGHWIEMKSVMGASAALESLVRLMPSQAHRLGPGGEVTDVAVSDLTPSDRVLVKPGEKVPIDGVVIDGRTSVNESLLTGESRPVEKGPRDEVIGGSINAEGSVVVEVRKTGDQTYLAQVVEMVRRAQQSRSRTQDLANRAALWLTIIALSAGAATLAAWLAVGAPFEFSLERMVTVMVITCPHALGLAVPLVVAVSTAISARSGLLIRDRSAFERARQVNAVLFDKTSTLTEGRFGVTDIVRLADVDEPALLRLAAAVESRSEHPIAQAIVQSARERNVDVPAVEDFRAIPGRGAVGTVEGRRIMVVSPGYIRDENLVVDETRATELAGQGKTVVYVLADSRALGAIALADIVRPESLAALRRLREMGIATMMITGDSQAVAAHVAGQLGLDDFFAGVLPDRKAQKVREVQDRGLVVAMVGDGVNDAPALVQADVGIAIGAGTDVAIESADIVLVRSDPRDVVRLLELARATYRKMVQNLLWATGYNAIAIPLAAGVLYRAGIVLSPAVGAALMAVSTVIVAVNARFLRVESAD